MRPTWLAPVARSIDVALVVVLLVVAAVAAVIVIVMLRNRSANSSVDSFRRHIDALGPGARRTTVDQVQSAAARNAGDDESADQTGDESPTTEPPTTDDRADEDGGRGT
jgi:hypothetical protein